MRRFWFTETCIGARLAVAASALVLGSVAVHAQATLPQTMPAIDVEPARSAEQAPNLDGSTQLKPSTETLVDQFIRLLGGSINLVGRDGAVLASRSKPTSQPATEPAAISEADLIAALRAQPLSDAQAAALWPKLADGDIASVCTPNLLKALVAASATLASRDAMWGELAGIATDFKGSKSERERTLLGLFERHRRDLLPLLERLPETEGAGNAMMDLVTTSRVFGDDVDDSVAWIAFNRPAAAARRVERERAQGRPVKWEYLAFDNMMRWRDQHLAPRASRAPKTLAALDEMGSTFITIVNAFHGFDEWYRRKMVEPLRPGGVFDAVIGGEAELYRLGTSSYQSFLHPVIMRGIKDSGSFEAFLRTTGPARLGSAETSATWQRGMVFLRIATAFARLDTVLATVKDQDRFIDDVVASLAEPVSFETNGSVLLDILTSRSDAAVIVNFRKRLLDRVYERYASETDDTRKKTFGSLLSVYQTVTGDRRIADIDARFPLDQSLLNLPYERLFSPDQRTGSARAGKAVVHRMFMRFDSDTDAVSSFGGFQGLMAARRAEVRSRGNHVVYRIVRGQRAIEVYANKPTTEGVKAGISELATALKGLRVHTVVGRGHTGILFPLRKDAATVLGPRLKDVAAVIVGTCGGTASVRDLISTFGYTPIVSTRSTGRQVINNAIIDHLLVNLLALPPDRSLALSDVVSGATAPLMRPTEDEDMREHAAFYDVNAANLFAAVLFDRHVRNLNPPLRQNPSDMPPLVAAAAREAPIPRVSVAAARPQSREGATATAGAAAPSENIRSVFAVER